MKSGDALRIGVVGLGRLGKRHAGNLYDRVGGAELVAVCSPDPAELAWARDSVGKAKRYDSFAALLAHQGLDAVWIVTPTTLHAVQIMQALDAGKHVFCEKPLSLDLAACLQVEAKAAAHPHLKVLIGYVRRFDASYQDAFAKIDSGLIGRPFLVRSQTADQYDPSGFFVKFAPSSGGIFLDMNVHDIDLARWYLRGAAIKRVFAAGTIAMHEGLRECGDVDNGLAICEFEGGNLAYFYASRMLPHGHETLTEIVGTKGRLTIGQNPRLNRVEIADSAGIRNECVPTFWERFEDAFLREAEAFVRMVRDDTAAPVGLNDATQATRIGCMLAEAYRSGTAVNAS